MIARESLLKAILICTSIVAIVVVSSSKAICAQPAPDLVVSMNVVPNPVPYGVGYEVQIIVSNLALPALIAPTMPRPSTLPSTALPGSALPPTSSPPQGVDVQQADLLLTGAVPPLAAIYGYVSMQTNPPLNVSSCQPAFGIFSNAIRCVIGPLPNGRNWTITLVYRAPNSVACPNAPCVSTGWFGATIDDRNTHAERNETNNSTNVSLSFQ